MQKKHRRPEPSPVSRLESPESSTALCIATDVRAGSGAHYLQGHTWLDLYEAENYSMFDSYPNGRASSHATRTDSDIRQFDAESRRYFPTSEYCVEVDDEQVEHLRQIAAEPNTWSYLHNCTSWAADTFNAVTGARVDVDDGWFFGVENPRSLADEIHRLKTLHDKPSN